MGSALEVDHTPDGIEQSLIRRDVAFYCSYCMLTGTSPKLVRQPAHPLADDVEPLLEELRNRLGNRVLFGVTSGTNTLTIPTFVDTCPYQMASMIWRSASLAEPVNLGIEETADYITMTWNTGMMVSLYKHVCKSLEQSLVSMTDYRFTVIDGSSGTGVATICSRIPYDSINSLRSVFSRPISISYKLSPGQCLLTIEPEEIARQTLKSFDSSSDTVKDNLLYNIKRIHTPQGVPKLDPYTRHGATPVEYLRIWSFIHCCRGILLSCQFSSLCVNIMEIHFLLAETRIVEYGDRKYLQHSSDS
jgi:hypothetical protein